MKKRIMLTLVCLLAAIGWVAAQNSPITGIVISAEDNEPIIGASVLVKVRGEKRSVSICGRSENE